MKQYKPTTPGQRGMSKEDFSILSKKRPEKRLVISLKKTGGRGNSGRITVRHRGGGAKKLYRIIDFGEEKLNLPAKVISLEYDPYCTAFIMLLQYQDGEKRYQILPQGLKVGDEIIAADKAEVRLGNRIKLKNIPVGTMVYNIELEPGRGGKMVRGAGTAAKVLAQEGGFTHLILPSTEVRKVKGECFASVGVISRPEHKYVKLGKAGKSRYRGKRPTVRGTAMNPCDHPHGGGEGKTSIGMPGPKTPWGKPARGVKTRRKKLTDKFIIQRRKKKK
ncbi:MAG: 50S ribosomal protein L2 [Candidatus Nealsonbacteria bacterium CG_4_9_14_0_2_um_filter_37_38]|uniref:Large ribosomal subunit protein uL2 n=1 Tax=Candidatus Nealsonbacteria bacterium CG_4_10_14_0_8_um_filter_37_14 TaxID=1974684 RepID=A0A2M7R619_9BACT|nr:MAG: 50S ribosomal protein L2 [Candidatus Nealsonbacteria bacterium CG11_big_fil_rev_8_21_14_0_20_37_68]PIW92006.1 MAG: 50S ribosomal protein L2 [Candidatus Nealsonbacteria bacterium CG_4_8_14_3_um_filter_37_23]PIY88969.1 MAG: 50S ribosomal protein L2 [Candidatus Nealsonbacteria bacterium CG_4_10_14_0_8_um_filter_37_14]PJC51531.1 MAG: 50S ribosomal protein L2 [Candidatus Nealsonbacteria bacterium CG_4_9_14_0_2_um_filter_37_38]